MLPYTPTKGAFCKCDQEIVPKT